MNRATVTSTPPAAMARQIQIAVCVPAGGIQCMIGRPAGALLACGSWFAGGAGR
jgi:hypothetical protein